MKRAMGTGNIEKIRQKLSVEMDKEKRRLEQILDVSLNKFQKEVTDAINKKTQQCIEKYKKISTYFSYPIEKLELKKSINGRLRRENIHVIADLLERTEDGLSQIKGIGKGALYQIKKALNKYGLNLRDY